MEHNDNKTKKKTADSKKTVKLTHTKSSNVPEKHGKKEKSKTKSKSSKEKKRKIKKKQIPRDAKTKTTTKGKKPKNNKSRSKEKKKEHHAAKKKTKISQPKKVTKKTVRLKTKITVKEEDEEPESDESDGTIPTPDSEKIGLSSIREQDAPRKPIAVSVKEETHQEPGKKIAAKMVIKKVEKLTAKSAAVTEKREIAIKVTKTPAEKSAETSEKRDITKTPTSPEKSAENSEKREIIKMTKSPVEKSASANEKQPEIAKEPAKKAEVVVKKITISYPNAKNTRQKVLKVSSANSSPGPKKMSKKIPKKNPQKNYVLLLLSGEGTDEQAPLEVSKVPKIPCPDGRYEKIEPIRKSPKSDLGSVPDDRYETFRPQMIDSDYKYATFRPQEIAHDDKTAPPVDEINGGEENKDEGEIEEIVADDEGNIEDVLVVVDDHDQETELQSSREPGAPEINSETSKTTSASSASSSDSELAKVAVPKTTSEEQALVTAQAIPRDKSDNKEDDHTSAE